MSELKNRLIACVRCGVRRQHGPNTKPLCGDCRWVLSEAEREAWAA